MLPSILLQAPQTGPLDVSDLWQTLVITLFILSMINERITNFIKLNIEDILTKLLGRERYESLFNCKPNFKLPQQDLDKEKEREGGIITWAVVCGFLVAASCGADLLYMFEHKGQLLPNEEQTDKGLSKILGFFGDHFLGYVLTAFFISLGSKFWHDLLDVILTTANLKKKLSEQADWDFAKPEDVKLYVNSYEIDSIRNAIMAAQVRFQDPAIVGYGIKKDTEGNYYIEVLTANDSVVVPPSIPYLHPIGKVKSLPIRAIKAGVAIPLIKPADEIGNTATGMKGTLGCIVRHKGQSDPLFLTCYHVVKPGSGQGWEFYDRARQSANDQIEAPDGSGQVVGTILEAKRNLTTDIAVIQPAGEVVDSIRIPIPEIGLVTQCRRITDLDLNTITVKKSGKNSKVLPDNSRTRKTTGTLTSRGYKRSIHYEGGDYELVDLLQIKSSNLDAFAEPGDSGSLVVDQDGYGIGIVVAKDDSFAYALPLDDVFNQFNLEFFSPPTLA